MVEEDKFADLGNDVEADVGRLLHHLALRHNFSGADGNFIGTPDRVTRAYEELLSGYNEKPGELLEKNFESGSYDQMVVVKDIDFYSLCAHHMLPFYGKIAAGYLPGESGKVVGLSKIARVCQAYARRFQLQERLTQQIAECIYTTLECQGVGVVIYDSVHFCMRMRGVKSANGIMQTSALLGDFRDDPAVRAEFMSLVR